MVAPVPLFSASPFFFPPPPFFFWPVSQGQGFVLLPALKKNFEVLPPNPPFLRAVGAGPLTCPFSLQFNPPPYDVWSSYFFFSLNFPYIFVLDHVIYGEEYNFVLSSSVRRRFRLFYSPFALFIPLIPLTSSFSPQPSPHTQLSFRFTLAVKFFRRIVLTLR